MHAIVKAVTERIIQRSQSSRQQYLQFIEQQAQQAQNSPARFNMSCTNQAHGYAASADDEKLILKQSHRAANIAIINSYNDVLSAHQPYGDYPEKIKAIARAHGHVAQVASGVPAMCDGITQGQEGMELSLFSRDAIALSTAVGLSHNIFDGVVLLGICDKIVPGLLMAALRFGHLPVVFLPSGPMHSGISNAEKAKTRQAFAAGKVDKEALLESELKSYHSAGTCTFYGTANSNQMLMEIMGLQLPGSSFLNPDHELRPYLNDFALQQLFKNTALEAEYKPVGKMLDERSFVNAIVGLLATGGSTNHSIHLLALARMAGIILDWQDISDLSDVVPLLARIYPNGAADINHFQQAGGMPFLIRELLQAGLLHPDAETLIGSLGDVYTKEPYLLNKDGDQTLQWRDAPAESLDLSVLAPAHAPFMREGGLKLLKGNIGKGLIKISAVPEERWQVTAPARVFNNQADVIQAYESQQLNQDVVVVVKHQGPKANGMPELHKLMPVLANLQDEGFRVALLTDGRLSGASGKVPALLHVCPEASQGGLIDNIQDGDLICIDAHKGSVEVDAPLTEVNDMPFDKQVFGLGRELFSVFRQQVGPADQGALSIDWSVE